MDTVPSDHHSGGRNLDFFIGNWYIPLALHVRALIFAFRHWVRTEQGRARWHSLLLKAPILGAVNRKVAVSRFCRTMSTLLDSGVPILTAVGIVEPWSGNDIIAEAIGGAGKNIAEGQSIAEPLKRQAQFPPLVTRRSSSVKRASDSGHARQGRRCV